jgi:hypothetical protein
MVAHSAHRGAAVAGGHSDFHRQLRNRLGALPVFVSHAAAATYPCGVLVNTSFNVRGGPIVCTPDDAYCCFMNTEMDYLIMSSFVIERTAQPQ